MKLLNIFKRKPKAATYRITYVGSCRIDDGTRTYKDEFAVGVYVSAPEIACPLNRFDKGIVTAAALEQHKLPYDALVIDVEKCEPGA